MRVGSLCTGYGGIELGLELAGEQVDLRWLAEFDAALDVLHPAGVPNLGDITQVDWSQVEPVDLITAGFPCQPFSSAGAQLAETDHRYLWPAVRDAVTVLSPDRVLIENVRNLVGMRKGQVWETILLDFLTLGYGVQWLTLGACAVGAAHHRHRVFALATIGDTVAERLNVQECGARRGGQLPTPRVSATRTSFMAATARHSRSAPSLDQALEIAAGTLPREFSSWDQLPDSWQLIPSPSASSYGSNQGGAAGRVGPSSPDCDASARLDLLPTPTASERTGSSAATVREGSLDLRTTVALLPTPRATDGVNGGPGQRGSSGDLAMPSAVQPEHWGRFADAVSRHTAIFDAPPPPTEPNRNGAPRLSAAFAEWLMCIPAGHVTDALPRNVALKAIGNGVCPPQLAQAWRHLTAPSAALDDLVTRQVRSSTMTDESPQPGQHRGFQDPHPVSAQIDEIKQRQADARGRVIAAAWKPSGFPGEEIAPTMPAMIEAALMELAKVWREESAWWEASGKRGGKGTAKELAQAAARLAGFAVGLSASVPPPAPTEPAPRSDYDERIADADGNVRDGRGTILEMGPALAARVAAQQAQPEPLTADTFLPPPPPVEHHAGEHVSVNPFINPPPPSHPKSRIVTRLTFADLPKLISDTYQVPRSHLSHSYLEDLSGCGLKALLSDAARHEVIGPRRPGWALVGGSAFHDVVEQIERAALAMGGAAPTDELGDPDTLWQSALDQAMDGLVQDLAGTAYADPSTWHVANKGLENYDWWRVHGADMVRLYLKVHDTTWRSAHTLLRVPATLDQLNNPLTEVLEFPYETTAAYRSTPPSSTTGAILDSGRIDAAWMAFPQQGLEMTYSQPTLEVIDYKSGSRDPGPDKRFQLMNYGTVLRKHLPPNFALPMVGRFYLARKGIYAPPVNLTSDQSVEVEYRFTQADRAMRSGVFLPNPSSFCSGCTMVDYCPTQTFRDA